MVITLCQKDLLQSEIHSFFSFCSYFYGIGSLELVLRCIVPFVDSSFVFSAVFTLEGCI